MRKVKGYAWVEEAADGARAGSEMSSQPNGAGSRAESVDGSKDEPIEVD